MNYVIFDLEYNQIDNMNRKLAKLLKTGRPIDFTKEILQIGAIIVDNEFNHISDFNMYVKPRFLPTISKKVLKIIDINEGYIKEKGLYFNKVFKEFEKFIGNEKVTFITWSSGDIEVLQTNIEAWNIEFQFNKFKRMDLQKIFMNKNNLKDTPSLEKIALDYKIDLNDVKLHDAYSDAIVTKQILEKLGMDNIVKYVYSANFRESYKLKENNLLQSEIYNTKINCINCDEIVKEINSVNMYKYKKNTFKSNKIFYCEKCQKYIYRSYIYTYKFGRLYINDKIIESEEHVSAINKRFEYLKEIEKEQHDMD